MKLNVTRYKILLAERCLTVKELAKQSGVTTMTLNKLKNGKCALPSTIGKIARALNVPVSELIKEEQDD